MHPVIFRAFERVCADRGIRGAVLEMGAVPDHRSLLNMAVLKGATEKIGINLKGGEGFADFKIVAGNANDMSCFPDARFDAVISNAMLEHDRYFWKTVAEVRRVTRPGGLVVLGVPGYTKRRMERWFSKVRKSKLIGPLFVRHFDWWNNATSTFRVHNDPGDFWRFSEQACRAVLLEGFEEVQVVEVMNPPRLIASGRKPGAPAGAGGRA